MTPPKLSFTHNKPVTNTSVFISWTYDEIATSHCTLKTPSSVYQVNCTVNEWHAKLLEGTYTLWIYGTDASENTKLAGIHTWTVGTFI